MVRQRREKELWHCASAVGSHSHDSSKNPTKSCPKINPTTKEKNTKSPGLREKEENLTVISSVLGIPSLLFNFFSMELCGVLVLLILILLFYYISKIFMKLIIGFNFESHLTYHPITMDIYEDTICLKGYWHAKSLREMLYEELSLLHA